MCRKGGRHADWHGGNVGGWFELAREGSGTSLEVQHLQASGYFWAYHDRLRVLLLVVAVAIMFLVILLLFSSLAIRVLLTAVVRVLGANDSNSHTSDDWASEGGSKRGR